MHTRSKLFHVLGLCSSLLAAPAFATDNFTVVAFLPGGGWVDTSYVDFAANNDINQNLLGFNYGTRTFASWLPPVRYLQVDLEAIGGGTCFEITTNDPISGPAANGDTRLWFQTPNSSGYTSLDDDSGPGNYSIGRVYLDLPTTRFTLYVAAYSDFYNTMHFSQSIERKTLTEAECTGQSTVPWVKSIGGVVTYGNTR
jgi:hypothetical protein